MHSWGSYIVEALQKGLAEFSDIYIAGAQEPGFARGMGMKTRAAIEEALEDAKRKFTGENPNILALPAM